MLAGVLWNGLGRGLPLLLALVLTPILVSQLGLERWGLFTLALALVGVFGIFDLGVGAALTRALSERIGHGEGADATRLTASALATLAGLSIIGATALFFAMPPLVHHVLNVPQAMRDETIAALRVLACAAPLVVLNAALWGVLAAYQKFRAANLVTMPVSIFYYLGPVLALLAWDSLVAVMLALVACRLANTLSYLWLIRPLLPGLWRERPRFGPALPLLRIGGWMTFSGTLGQALIYADRFLVGSLLTLAAVAFYATPLDLVLRFWILPVAVANTLVPALASAYRAMPERTAALLHRGALVILAVCLPAALLLLALAGPVLRLWLGAEFEAGSAMVLRILCVGILFSCLAYAPNALLDAIGRPDQTARLTMAEVVVFLPLTALLLLRFGIEGAAIGFTLRCMADCAGKLWLVSRCYPPAAAAVRRLAAPLAVAGLGLAAMVPLPGWQSQAVLGALVLAGTLAATLATLDPAERAGLHLLLRDPRAALRRGKA
jgi:O-antigen/teichoic acid export membrane protein